MNTITAVGIDLAKNIFHIYGVNQAEKKVLSRKVSRNQLSALIAKLPASKIFMEACGSAHYWAKTFRQFGHDVRLIAGQHVKKFVVGNKNDEIDARAIVTCGLRPSTRFVPIKTEAQLEVQALHRIRSRLVRERTALCHEMRAFLYEQGIIISKTRRALERNIRELLTKGTLRSRLSEIISNLFTEYLEKSRLIEKYEREILRSFENHPSKEQLVAIPGVGPITASAMLSEIDPNEFENGRHLAAFLGIVPRHQGSGGRNVNYSISKRGDCYIRTLLIHGARSAMRHTNKRNDPLSQWCEKLKSRMPANKASVALANKNARIIWKILKTGEAFKSDLAAA